MKLRMAAVLWQLPAHGAHSGGHIFDRRDVFTGCKPLGRRVPIDFTIMLPFGGGVNTDGGIPSR
jgi:hypothetical protein